MAGFDTGGAIGGAASGGATGFSLGGPVGGGIGAVAGGLLGAFRKKRKAKRLSTLDPMQKGIFSDLGKSVQGQGGPFGDLFNYDANQANDVFNKNVADPAYQNYKENVVPSITGQFRGGNLQNSSYLGGALSKAGTDVQRNLDAQRSNFMYQGQNDSVNRRVNAINSILGTQTFAYQQPQQSAGDQAFGALMDTGGQIAGQYAANKFGSMGQQPFNPTTIQRRYPGQ